MELDLKTTLALLVIVIAGCTIADTIEKHVDRQRLLNKNLMPMQLTTAVTPATQTV